VEEASIVIIGGGFCGTLVAHHLLKDSSFSGKVFLINNGHPIARGIAYSAYSDHHFLNVTAGKMSALPDEPDHFVNWVLHREKYKLLDKELVSKTYLPRKLYGSYLEDIWSETQQSGNGRLIVKNDLATSISQRDGQYVTTLQSGTTIQSKFVVLATGNEIPANLRLRDPAIFDSPYYFQNPWAKTSVENPAPGQDVLIVGNGLTMVDTVLGLKENGFTGKIYSLSPNGFAILPHRHNGIVYTNLIKEITEPFRLIDLLRLFNKHVKLVRHLGLSAEPVIDSVRPLTQKIWQALSLEEKKEFMDRLRHLWGVARHRLPIHIYDQIIRMKLEQRLIVLSGRIQSMDVRGQGVDVRLYNKRSKQNELLHVGRVINCTGPETNIARSQNPLLQQLYKTNILQQDELGLGVLANEVGQVIGSKGLVKEFFVMGNLMKGVLWESTAVPELRVMAKRVASEISLNITK
jgi:uncharacterized NAD(P)/FAD-binding protein YdhS